jgi:hypothetical protein
MNCLIEGLIDAINHPEWKINSIYGPDRPYEWNTIYEFSTIWIHIFFSFSPSWLKPIFNARTHHHPKCIYDNCLGCCIHFQSGRLATLDSKITREKTNEIECSFFGIDQLNLLTPVLVWICCILLSLSSLVVVHPCKTLLLNLLIFFSSSDSTSLAPPYLHTQLKIAKPVTFICQKYIQNIITVKLSMPQ